MADSRGLVRVVYVCRKDDLIKHVTGEFTNPLVTEHEMMNACTGLIHAACMVGNSQSRPWLILEICESLSPEDVDVNRINAALELANSKQPKYSHVLPRVHFTS